MPRIAEQSCEKKMLWHSALSTPKKPQPKIHPPRSSVCMKTYAWHDLSTTLLPHIMAFHSCSETLIHLFSHQFLYLVIWKAVMMCRWLNIDCRASSWSMGTSCITRQHMFEWCGRARLILNYWEWVCIRRGQEAARILTCERYPIRGGIHGNCKTS